MSLQKPHVQTLFILIVCLLVVVGTAYVVYGTSQQDTGPDSTALAPIVSPSEPIDASDDWRTQFETSTTQNGPDTTPSSDTVLDETSEPETITGQFGRKFFEQYMYLKQNNLHENSEAIQALIDQATENVVSGAPEIRVYDIREMVLSADSGVEAERAYAQNIGMIFTAHMPRSDAARAALKALEDDDPAGIDQVKNIATSYTTLLGLVMATPVPRSLSTYHVQLVNGLSAMSFASSGLTEVFSDPLRSIVAIAIYEQSVNQLLNALLDIKFVLNEHGLTFSASDPASIIFSMVQ